MIRFPCLFLVLATAGCYDPTYQASYRQYGAQSPVVLPYDSQASIQVYPSYQEPIFVAPRYSSSPVFYDRGFAPYRGGFGGGFEPGYGRQQYGDRREQRERQDFRQEQQFQQRDVQQRQNVYNSHVRDLQVQHNQGVVGLQQQFNQGRINKDQLNNGYRQLENNMNGAIANEQRALPR